jgi:LEA14-like dessication related protein
MARALLSAVVLLASMPNCTDLYSAATHGVQAPVVTTDQRSTTAVPDPQGVRVSIVLNAQNPNAFPIQVDSVDYQVAINGTPVFAGTQEGATVDEDSSEKVTLSGVVDMHQAVFATLRSGQTVPLTVTGVAHADSPAGLAVDVSFKGTDSFVVPTLP